MKEQIQFLFPIHRKMIIFHTHFKINVNGIQLHVFTTFETNIIHHVVNYLVCEMRSRRRYWQQQGEKRFLIYEEKKSLFLPTFVLFKCLICSRGKCLNHTLSICVRKKRFVKNHRRKFVCSKRVQGYVSYIYVSSL